MSEGGLLRFCKSEIHPRVTRWYSTDQHCPECTERLQQMTRPEILDAYRGSSHAERYRLALIYHGLEDKDPNLDWVQFIKDNGGTPPEVF